MAESVSSVACQNCREQHLKCDGAVPACARCVERGRVCTRYRFRQSTERFLENQQWMKVPNKLEFISDPDASTISSVSEWEILESPAISQVITPSSPQTIGPVEPETSFPAPVVTPVPTPGSPSDRFIQPDRPQTSSSLSSQPLYLDKPAWPLTNRTEAILFRHFRDNLAIWLDLCDPLHHFTTFVPQNAATCPILLNAMFALAARHLTHIGRGPPDLDPLASNRYHEACLSALIPMMANSTPDFGQTSPPPAVTDENLFAATIILRVLEEMEESHEQLGMDARGHLLGIHAFVHAIASGPTALSLTEQLRKFGSLWAACFWVGLRQEIYTSMMQHAPVQVNLAHAIVDRSLDHSNDPTTWANRAVVHCADVLNFCFGDVGGTDVRLWEELYDWNCRWYECLPNEFQPVYVSSEEESGGFPEIWFSHGSHIIGVQHHDLATLFLLSYDPRIPKIGPQRKTATERASIRIQALVRRLCGIGTGNASTPPGTFAACMAIAAFGDRFTERADQETMIDILKRAEEAHARPTAAVQEQLMQTWEWQ